MPHLRLSEPDRERIGGPELLPFRLRGMTNREAIEIAKLGYKTPTLLRKALFETGPEGLDPLAWTAAVWMSLRAAGVESDLQTLEFDLDALAYVPDEEPQPPESGEPGKAPAPSKPSARKRSTSGATSRARSRSTSPSS